MNHEPRTASLLVEGVAMTLFFATLALWLGILAGRI